jgi:uncharacterized protein (UPF0333 family)
MIVTLTNIREFIKEDGGQVSIEYYLILATALIAAAMMASSYYKIAYNKEYSYIKEIEDTYDSLCEYIAGHLDVEEVNQFCD